MFWVLKIMGHMISLWLRRWRSAAAALIINSLCNTIHALSSVLIRGLQQQNLFSATFLVSKNKLQHFQEIFQQCVAYSCESSPFTLNLAFWWECVNRIWQGNFFRKSSLVEHATRESNLMRFRSSSFLLLKLSSLTLQNPTRCLNLNGFSQT